MITATERGKMAMNGKPPAGLQRKKEYSVLSDGKWHYPNPFKIKVYTVFMDWGDMDFPSMKLKTNEPQLWREVYEEIRGDMMEAGILKTKEEAAEDRKLQREKDLLAQVALVQKKGEEQLQKASLNAKPGNPQEIGKEHPVAHNAGMRTGTVMESALQAAEELKAKAIAQFGTRISPEGTKVRKHLLTYSLTALRALKHEEYQKQKADYKTEYALFHSNKQWVIKFYESEQPKAEAPVVVAPDMQPPVAAPVVPETPKTRKAINVLGTVPIVNIPAETRKQIKELLTAALKIITQDKPDGGYTFVTLDDPPEIEIRETVWY